MIRYQKLSYSDAKVIIAEYDSYDDNEFKYLENHWRANDVSASAFDPSYEDFRHELLAEFNSALVETSGKMTYLLDLRVGIKLFQLMPLDSNFSIIEANNAGFLIPIVTKGRGAKYKAGVTRGTKINIEE